MSTNPGGKAYQAEALVAADIDAYLEAHQHKSLLRFITCGSVDDGKSTLIGRLLYESKQIFDDQLDALADRQLRRILRERHALDMLHDEIGQARLGRASVEQPRDVRMLERCQSSVGFLKRRADENPSLGDRVGQPIIERTFAAMPPTPSPAAGASPGQASP